MKKIIFSLSVALFMSSCIVIKVYDTPKSKDAEPKLIAKKRMMLPSDRNIPLPNGGQEILCFGEDFPPKPEVFHFKMDDSIINKNVGDSLKHKEVFIFKMDNMDSLSKGLNFQWKSKESMHHSIPHKMMKACCMMSTEECTKKDSVCAPMMHGVAKGEKSIRLIKIDKKDAAVKNTFVIKTKDSEGEKARLFVIAVKENAAGFDLESIVPDQIKRIDVLKDEAATKKFGEKGANGVILITMKEQ
jgi:TonB-dependent SusC/RagA subfamily outer membrane receptor